MRTLGFSGTMPDLQGKRSLQLIPQRDEVDVDPVQTELGHPVVAVALSFHFLWASFLQFYVSYIMEFITKEFLFVVTCICVNAVQVPNADWQLAQVFGILFNWLFSDGQQTSSLVCSSPLEKRIKRACLLLFCLENSSTAAFL